MLKQVLLCGYSKSGMVLLQRRLFIIFITIFLFSCADSVVRNNVEFVEAKPVASYIAVEPDVALDFKKAIVLMRQDNNAQAITVLKTVIEREQRLPAPFVNIAIAYNKLGDSKSAEENLIKALKLDIKHPTANNELGLLYRKAGKFKAARTAYQNAIKGDPEYLSAIRNLGVLCDLYIHDFECALEQFEDYLELKPDDKTVAIWVADVKHRLAK